MFAHNNRKLETSFSSPKVFLEQKQSQVYTTFQILFGEQLSQKEQQNDLKAILFSADCRETLSERERESRSLAMVSSAVIIMHSSHMIVYGFN